MFDFEKMLKPVFEKHVPAIMEAFEKNKKRDWVLAAILEYPNLSNEEETLDALSKLSAKYDQLNKLYESVSQ